MSQPSSTNVHRLSLARRSGRLDRILARLDRERLKIEAMTKGSITVNFAGDHFKIQLTELLDDEPD